MDYAGAVDENFHRTHFRFNRIRTARERGLIGYVDDPGAAIYLARHRVHALTAIQQDDLRTARRQLAATGRADAARTAGNDCHARKRWDSHSFSP